MSKSWKEEEQWQCEECNFIGTLKEYDKVDDPRPLSSSNHWYICPECRAADQMRTVCHHTDCYKAGTCGAVQDGKYRWTCSNHSVMKNE